MQLQFFSTTTAAANKTVLKTSKNLQVLNSWSLSLMVVVFPTRLISKAFIHNGLFNFCKKISKNHGVWKSQNKSHSTLRAKWAMLTFWMDKSKLKMPKMVHLGEFLIIWSLRSNSVTRQFSFNRTKNWWKMPKLKNSNTTFRVIFKQCENRKGWWSCLRKLFFSITFFSFSHCSSFWDAAFCLSEHFSSSLIAVCTQEEQPTGCRHRCENSWPDDLKLYVPRGERDKRKRIWNKPADNSNY